LWFSNSNIITNCYPVNQSFGGFLKNFCVCLGLVFFFSRSFNRLHRNSMGFTLADLLTLLTANLSPSAYGQTAHFSGAQSTVASSGLNLPIGVAVDGSGNIYIADTVNNRVLKETPSNGGYIESTIVSSLPNSPWAVAADGSGDIYISIPDSNQVLIETLAGGAYTQSTVGSGMNGPHGVGVDSKGNVYIADTGNNRVLIESLSSGSYTQSTVVFTGTPLSQPTGLALDTIGDIYIADTGNNRVLEAVAEAGGYFQTPVATLSQPSSIAIDSLGNVYITDSANNQLLKAIVSNSFLYNQQSVIASGLNDPAGIAIDSSGNIYFSEPNNNLVLKRQLGAVNFGPVNIGNSAGTHSLIYTFDTAGTPGRPLVLTQGTLGLDFTDAGTGSCTTNATPYSYNVGDTCMVDVTFTPKVAGARYGAAVLQGGSGTILPRATSTAAE
jgi:sugar lactone lactonase YvrE